MGFLIWGSYGFPHFAIVAIGIASFVCFAGLFVVAEVTLLKG
jgi:hypothetical protein